MAPPHVLISFWDCDPHGSERTEEGITDGLVCTWKHSVSPNLGLPMLRGMLQYRSPCRHEWFPSQTASAALQTPQSTKKMLHLETSVLRQYCQRAIKWWGPSHGWLYPSPADFVQPTTPASWTSCSCCGSHCFRKTSAPALQLLSAVWGKAQLVLHFCFLFFCLMKWDLGSTQHLAQETNEQRMKVPIHLHTS